MNNPNLPPGPLYPSRKTGQERFRSSGEDLSLRILDFWRWSSSDLLSNTTRGILAEFLVASDLGVANGVRNEWDPYDLTGPGGEKIEVKTSAYLQSWHQEGFSRITFDIKPTTRWNPETNAYEGGLQRQSDVYAFCLLHHKDKLSVNPLDLDQWTFYLLPTKILDAELPTQKSLSLSSLLKLGPVKCWYGEIKQKLKALQAR